MRTSRQRSFWPDRWQVADSFNRARNAGVFPPRARKFTSKGKLWQKVVAIIVIAAMLSLVGVAPVVIACAIGIGVLIVLAIRRSIKRETELIFEFYVDADEVLSDKERRRYQFEVTEVIRSGELAVRSMPDPPPLSGFALGALYSLIGDHNAVVEHLGIAAEEELLKESSHVSPSRKLRRYVKRLRQIERSPQRWPKFHNVIVSLEQMQQERAPLLLAEGHRQLKKLVEAYEVENAGRALAPPPVNSFDSNSVSPITAPPSISQVLNDVYQDETS